MVDEVFAIHCNLRVLLTQGWFALDLNNPRFYQLVQKIRHYRMHRRRSKGKWKKPDELIWIAENLREFLSLLPSAPEDCAKIYRQGSRLRLHKMYVEARKQKL